MNTSLSMKRLAPLRVGLIGHGAIGRVIARELLALAPDAGIELVGVLCRHVEEGEGLSVPVCTERESLLALEPQLVVEAAGHEAVRAHGPAFLAAGADLLVVSVGALAEVPLLDALESAARRHGRQVLLPSGALAGLDWLQSARLAGLNRVCYRSRKPPQAWQGTPAEQALNLAEVREATVFFRGTAREAAIAYPKNANVAATLALCTLGLEQTQVELIADPQAGGNVHEIEAQGSVGRLQLQVQNLPAPDNPKTSLVTPYSALRTLLARRAALSL